MNRLWDKGEPLDDLVLRFTVGNDHLLDQRLVPYDVLASIGHARMLQECGYLSASEFTALETELNTLAASHARGDWAIDLKEEDVHTALELRLVKKLGDIGKKIHLGRSRNDQVLAALRLYLKDAGRELAEGAAEVVRALDSLVSAQGSIPLPGHTHLQRAMPSSVALWASAYRAEIEDDIEGLRAALRRADKNPLGSAAGYGVPILKLDRALTTQHLGFARVQEPVTAVQLSRGKAEASLAFELVLMLQDVGRLASDLCLYASTEFGWVRLPDRFTTGSSIMPQKRNPDVFELVRARSARASSDLTAILALTAKMPSGYHRDLQLVKEPLFRILDDARDVLAIMARALPELRFLAEQCQAASADPALHATAEAYRLVEHEGLSFREAYRVIAAKFRTGPKGASPPP